MACGLGSKDFQETTATDELRIVERSPLRLVGVATRGTFETIAIDGLEIVGHLRLYSDWWICHLGCDLGSPLPTVT